MKTILLLTLCFIGFDYAFAADVDARLVRYSGDTPSTSDLVRLVESDSIATSTSFSAIIAANNSFSHDAIKQVEYPTDFDTNGKPDATEMRNTGITFSGQAIPSEETYNLNFQFRLNELKSTLFSSLKNGIIISQPIFRSKELKTKVAAKLNNWIAFPLADDDDGCHSVLLLRIRK